MNLNQTKRPFCGDWNNLCADKQAVMAATEQEKLLSNIGLVFKAVG